MATIEGVRQILVDLWDFTGDIPKITLRPLAHILIDTHGRLAELRDNAEQSIKAARARAVSILYRMNRVV